MNASNINMNMKNLMIDFLQEETLEAQTQPSFIVNGVTVNPNSDLDLKAPPLPLVKITMPTIESWSFLTDLTIKMFQILNI